MGRVSPKAIQFVLQGQNNETLEGTLILDHLPSGLDEGVTTVPTTPEPYDEQGASAYAIVVIAVYGFSIVLLIASHIFLKKKADKRDGDEQQIDKYLQQVPDLKEKSKRESFRRLKKSIIPLVSIGMGHDLSSLAQTPPGYAVRQNRQLKPGDFDSSECNSRRSSYENDPNRPLLDWIERETARRASIVSIEVPPSPIPRPETTQASSESVAEEHMPVIYEEGSEEGSTNRPSPNVDLQAADAEDSVFLPSSERRSPSKRASSGAELEDQESDLSSSPERRRKNGLQHDRPYQNRLPECPADLWLVQGPGSMTPDHSPPLPRGSDMPRTPPQPDYSPSHKSPRRDSSPRRYRGSYPSPSHSQSKFTPISCSPSKKERDTSDEELDEPTEDLLQVTCV